MADRVAVVTGAGRGVGAAIARQLSADDWVVVVADLGTALDGSGYDPDPSQAVSAEIWDAGGSARPVCADVTTRSGLEFVLETATSLGNPMALIHAAGILADQPVAGMTDEAWRSVLAVHLDAAFGASRAFWPLFEAAGGGTIVLLGSSVGFVGAPGRASYAAAKAGLLGLTRVLAQEGIVSGITANLVLPFADTRMSLPERTGPGEAGSVAGARAEDVAPLVSWLCSEAGGGVTGQVLGVRGAELTVWSQPRPVSRIVATEGWTPQALSALLHPAQTTHMVPLDTDADVLGGPVIPVRNPATVQGQVLATPERRLPVSLTPPAPFPGDPPVAWQPRPPEGLRQPPQPERRQPDRPAQPRPAQQPHGGQPKPTPAPAGAAGDDHLRRDPDEDEIRLEPDDAANAEAPGEPGLLVDLEHDTGEDTDEPARPWPANLIARRRGR